MPRIPERFIDELLARVDIVEVVEAEGNTGSGANIMDFPHDAHRAVIADFLDAIETGRDPVVTGEEALISQRWIDAILAAGR